LSGYFEGVIDMKEQTITAVLEDSKRGLDWPVSIIYEHDGGIQINGVYDDHDDADTDWVKELTPDQYTQVELACIDDYESLGSAAEAAAEDRAEWLYEDRKSRSRG
jgi:hypothetical protein